MGLTRRQVLWGGAALPLAGWAISSHSARAAAGRIYSHNGIAVDGSDMVAYFTEGAPTKGRADITHDWMGVTWRFASTENRNAFARDPAAYAPQYGGFCAYAVSKGYTASTVPEAWKVVDGKLYLNYSRRIQRKWERDIEGHIAAADANWPTLVG